MAKSRRAIQKNNLLPEKPPGDRREISRVTCCECASRGARTGAREKDKRYEIVSRFQKMYFYRRIVLSIGAPVARWNNSHVIASRASGRYARIKTRAKRRRRPVTRRRKREKLIGRLNFQRGTPGDSIIHSRVSRIKLARENPFK